MAALIKHHSTFNGVKIFAAANTHPESKTTSLLIFTEDLIGYTGKNQIVRFRYERCNSESHTNASCEAAKFIKANQTK